MAIEHCSTKMHLKHQCFIHQHTYTAPVHINTGKTQRGTDMNTHSTQLTPIVLQIFFQCTFLYESCPILLSLSLSVCTVRVSHSTDVDSHAKLCIQIFDIASA